nr:hypothetical protein [uncultured Psychroserpens sp.]
MRLKFLYVIFCFAGQFLIAQQAFHVFPKTDSMTPGSELGNGSLTNPWDLQTALNQKPDTVNSGDIIWIHSGVYNGRFISNLQSLEPNAFITVSAFKNDTVVLNGNVESDRNTVLEVKGQGVIFKNFEITWLGDFSRDENDEDFQVCSGIRHLTGANCRFYNLKIYNNPGLGIGSWKHGAGTIIENCMIYNNGFMSKNGKGRGEGIYVQNKSDQERIIRNNIIFNNFYKGIEVWSAGKRADFQYVKNITLEHNIIFNSGSPSGKFRDNVIVASDDRNGINLAKNISVLNNVLYHNTSQANGNLIGDAPSLTLGFNPKAPIENVIVDGNVITGGYNGLRILQAKSLQFTNNKVYTGIVQVSPSISNYFEDWNFNSNTIYSKRKKPYRITRIKDHSLGTWYSAFQLDKDTKLIHISSFNLDNILHVSKHSQYENRFNLALFNAEGHDVTVDFSEYNIKANTTFNIYDAENPKVVLKSGLFSEDSKITFPMQLTEIEQPLHNTKASKTLTDFGVFILEFESDTIKDAVEKKRDNALKRFFKWLGF